MHKNVFEKLQDEVCKNKLEEYMLKKISNIPNSYLNKTSMNFNWSPNKY